jgi:hypothetical protein
MIWNRDAEHQEGIQRILETIQEGISPEMKPRDGSYYYKKHSEHAGFKGTVHKSEKPGPVTSIAEETEPSSA